jgi:hypothetical protein
VLLGGGTRSLASALWLAAGGAEPTVLSGGRLAADNSGLTRRALLHRLHDRGVRLVTGRAEALQADSVLAGAPDGSALRLAADGLVVCEPVQPQRFVAGSARSVVRVGDCRRVGDIPAAVADARDAVDAFTRAIATPAG